MLRFLKRIVVFVAVLVVWVYIFRCINQSIREAGLAARLPYLVTFETGLVWCYIRGIVLMLIGIGKDVTVLGVLTFDLRDFKPETNLMYRAGFYLNRFGAFSSLYILFIAFAMRKMLPPHIIWLCVADVVGVTIVSCKLTRVIKWMSRT